MLFCWPLVYWLGRHFQTLGTVHVTYTKALYVGYQGFLGLLQHTSSVVDFAVHGIERLS